MKKNWLIDFLDRGSLKKLWRIMRITMVLIVGFIMTVNAESYSQTTRLDIRFENRTIRDVIEFIEENSEFVFLYKSEDFNLNKKVAINLKNATIDQILKKTFKGENVTYDVYERQIVIRKAEVLKSVGQQDKKSITGVVTDKVGDPIPGVSIVVKGTTIGATTNFNGIFNLEIPATAKTLQFSFVGMKLQEIVIEDKTQFTIVMQDDTENIDEVVVTALGILSKKKSLGYSVNKIAGDEIAMSKETNIVNSLTGRVAGVKITPAASGMGGSSRLIIRGSSSLTGNNQPLYVVDGIPIDNTGFGGASTGGAGVATERTDYGTGISDINPSDIETMSILKGPNAAALYGSRAANGAIIITTKKGRARKGIGISYSGTVMASTLHESTLPGFQNEYGQGDGGTFANDATNSWGAKLDGSTFEYPTGLEGVYSPQPNNVKDFFNTGIEQTHAIALEGGNEDGYFRFSYTYFEGKGILPNSKMDKNTINLRAGAKLSDKVSFDSKVTYFTQDANNRAVMGWTSRSPTNTLYRMVRNGVINDYKDNYQDETGMSIDPYSLNKPAINPYYVQNRYVDEDQRQRIMGFAKVTYMLNENFSAFIRVGTDALSQKITSIIPWGGDFRTVEGKRSDSRVGLTETNADFLLMFNKEFSSNFNLNLNAGGNYRLNNREISSRSGENFNIPTSTLYSNLRTLYAGQETKQRSSIQSLYFSGSVDYKEMVYLNFTGRNDWDSGLWTASGSSKEWSFFYPSLSLSLLGNELFGLDNSVLSFSKLRVAWSEVGSGGYKNDQIFYYLSNSTGYNGLISVAQSNIYDDPNLGPEKTTSTELGLELKFFNNRLYTDFTIYKSSTLDQIINAPVDASTGFEFMRTNVGEISNKGFELMVGGTPMQTDNFTWDISVNIAKNTSVLESFIEGSESFLFTGRDNYSVKTKVGGEYGDIWGNDFVYHDGKLVVDDNGVPVSSAEEQLLGNYNPDLAGGLFNSFRYKNMSLGILIDGQLGGEAISWTRFELGGRYGVLDATLEGREGMTLDAVVNTGTEENPVYAANTTETNAQAYWAKLEGIPGAHMQDLTNIRLREVTLSYDLPSKWFSKTPINRISASLIGRNLLFFVKKADGVDPESSVSVANEGQGVFYYNMPSTRRIGFSLNVSF